MNLSSPAVLRRKRRRTAFVLGAVFFALVALHIRNRVADRAAWPAPAPDVALEPVPMPAALAAPGATNAWHLFAALPAPREDFPDIHAAAMKELGGGGIADAAGGRIDAPALDAWVVKMAPALALWHEAAESGAASFCDTPDLPTQYAVLSKARECALLTQHRATRTRRDGDRDACLAAWRDTLLNAPKMTFGTGTAGQVVAYDMTLGVTRDILATLAPRSALADEWRSAAGTDLRADLLAQVLAAPSQPLAESIRHDGVAARAVLGAFFPGDTSFAPPPPGLDPPSGLFRWIARHNGSAPDVSAAHLDAVLSHVVAAALRPYTASGLYAELPAWCRGRRPPWTNDPAAATAVCHLRDNTLSAGVYPVLREMELRAALYAVRLSGGDTNAPPADPFSPDGSPFVLDAPPPDWRFHSVGPDQRDDGGVNDWATARRAGPGLDFLFSHF